jgi:hypothetical protein
MGELQLQHDHRCNMQHVPRRLDIGELRPQQIHAVCHIKQCSHACAECLIHGELRLPKRGAANSTETSKKSTDFSKKVTDISN